MSKRSHSSSYSNDPMSLQQSSSAATSTSEAEESSAKRPKFEDLVSEMSSEYKGKQGSAPAIPSASSSGEYLDGGEDDEEMPAHSHVMSNTVASAASAPQNRWYDEFFAEHMDISTSELTSENVPWKVQAYTETTRVSIYGPLNSVDQYTMNMAVSGKRCEGCYAHHTLCDDHHRLCGKVPFIELKKQYDEAYIEWEKHLATRCGGDCNCRPEDFWDDFCSPLFND